MQNYELDKDCTRVNYLVHQQVFQSHPQPTKVMSLEAFLDRPLQIPDNHETEQHYEVSPHKITPQAHHSPHRNGLRDHSSHGSIGEVVGGRHHKNRGIKDTISFRGVQIDRVHKLVVEAWRGLTPNNLPDRTSFMSMFNFFEFDRAGNEQMCINSARQVACFSKHFKHVIGATLGPDPCSLGTTTRSDTLEEGGTQLQKR